MQFEPSVPSSLYHKMLAAEDPYPILHRLRAEHPVYFVSPEQFWLVTRYQDIERLLHYPGYVSLDGRNWEKYRPALKGSLLRWNEDNGLFCCSDEHHSRLRRLLRNIFSPISIVKMGDRIRNTVHETYMELVSERLSPVDLIAEFTSRVPYRIICQLVGLKADDDEAEYRKTIHKFICVLQPNPSIEDQQFAESALHKLLTWINRTMEERMAFPKADVVSYLLQIAHSKQTLTENDIRFLLLNIVGAGVETTAFVAQDILLLLYQDIELLEQLKADRSLANKGLLEIIRYAVGGPAGLMRFALCDFELGGQRIRQGQMLMLSRGGANRDPAVFENPDQIDLKRPIVKLPVFGRGTHRCLGEHLAMAQLQMMVEVFLDYPEEVASRPSEKWDG
ncbi:MAG: cytochrome P450 [Myxococcales bacterium]|nr:cytochrome P450 [Myxococcales bacterium]